MSAEPVIWVERYPALHDHAQIGYCIDGKDVLRVWHAIGFFASVQSLCCHIRPLSRAMVSTATYVAYRSDLAVGGVLWPACGRIFEILLTPVRRTIEERLRIGQPFDAALECSIRMVDSIA